MYSLAAVLYEMLAGEPPSTGPTAQAMIARRLSEPPPSVRAVRPSGAGRRGRGHPEGARAGRPPTGSPPRRSSPRRCRAAPDADRRRDRAGAGGRADAHASRPRPSLAVGTCPRWRVALTAGLLIGGGLLFAWRAAPAGRRAAERHARRRGAPVRQPGRLGRRVLRRRRERRGAEPARQGGGPRGDRAGQLARVPPHGQAADARSPASSAPTTC